MFKPFFNNLFHMIICKRIVYNLSLSAEFHQVGKTQRFRLSGACPPPCARALSRQLRSVCSDMPSSRDTFVIDSLLGGRKRLRIASFNS